MMMLKRKTQNKLLLLHVIQQLPAHQIKGISDIQKLAFANETRSRDEENYYTFNYQFIIWTHGPYSTELYEDIKSLQAKRCLAYDEEANVYALTELGKEKIEQSNELMKLYYENKTISEVIRRWLKNEPLNERDYRKTKLGKVIEDIKFEKSFLHL